jgi:predicted RNA binding protein YcfA (HicA-like mRNA interferase family)
VGKHDKLLELVLQGRSDANIAFSDLCALLLHLGFEERTRGSHHIFRRDGVEERINLQRDGANAKPYQVRQVRHVVLRYGLGSKSDV